MLARMNETKVVYGKSTWWFCFLPKIVSPNQIFAPVCRYSYTGDPFLPKIMKINQILHSACRYFYTEAPRWDKLTSLAKITDFSRVLAIRFCPEAPYLSYLRKIVTRTIVKFLLHGIIWCDKILLQYNDTLSVFQAFHFLCWATILILFRARPSSHLL